MNIMIIGAGRLGTGLAVKLVKEKHHVTIIDNKQSSFNDIEDCDALKKVLGMGFDKEVLEHAGIEKIDALVASTSSDETNALIARIAKNIYRVPRVIARLYDPNKAQIYSAFGIQTISTTTWGIQRASEIITYNQLDAVLSIGNSEVEVVKLEVPVLLVGKMVDELSMLGEARIVSIVRDNKAFIPTNGTTFELHDIIFISVLSTSLQRVKKALGLR